MSKRTALVWGRSAHAGQAGTRNRHQRARFAAMIEGLEVRQLLSIPAAPTNLNATPNDESRINVTWTDNSDNEEGFIVERSLNGTSGWVQAGTTIADDNTFTDSGLLEATTYWYRAKAYNSDGGSGYSNKDSEWTNPTRPTDLVVQVSQGNAALTWIDHSSKETGFTIARSVDGVWGTAITVSTPNLQSYSYSGSYSQDHTYAFRVRSLYAPASNRTSHANYTPNAPSNVTAATYSETEIDVSWTDTSSDEASFRIDRSPNGTSGWTEVGTTGVNATTFRDSGLSEVTPYYYTVWSVHSTGGRIRFTWSESPYTNWAATNPNRPTNLVVEISPSRAVLTWQDNSNRETDYLVYQYVYQWDVNSGWYGEWQYRIVIPADSTSYTFSYGLGEEFGPSRSYAYRVRSWNDTYSRSSHAPYTPVATSYVTATPIDDDQIEVSWTDFTDNQDPDLIGDYVIEKEFLLQRSTDGSTWTDLQTLQPDTTSFTDTGLDEATTYYYRLWAVHSTLGKCAFTWPVGSATTLLSAPTNLAATATASDTIALAWQDNSGAETGFQIERSLDGSSWELLDTVGANVTTFSDTGLSPATTYYYRVVAYGPSGESLYDEPASATTLA